MAMKDLVVIGACGEAFEIIDSVSAINKSTPTWNIAGIVDDDKEKWGKIFYNDVSIIGSPERLSDFDLSSTEFIITLSAISSFLKKSAYINQLIGRYPGISFARVIHPQAHISDTSRIGYGTYIAAGVAVDANAVIGNHCIVHFYSVISRFVEIDDFTFISSSVNITGNKKIGRSVYLGVKSTLNANVGDNVLVSSGTIIKNDVPANSIVSNTVGQNVITVDSTEELQTILGDFGG